MRVIPAVDMKDGECVQLVQGEPGTEKIYGDPLDAASRWVEMGAEVLHLVDLDGALDDNRRNTGIIRDIASELDVKIQVGGGIRSISDAEDVFDAGADRVIVGTAAVENPGFVGDLSGLGDVMVSLDSSMGEVVVEGWTEGSGVSAVELVGVFEEQGAESVLFTDVDREGLLEGVDLDVLRDVIESTSLPVVASGGISSIQDIRDTRDIGAYGVVIGTAFYEGKIDYRQARRAVN